VSLSWTGSAGATSYNVYAGTASGGESATATASVTITIYTNTGLSNGTKYFYIVRAVNSTGTSAASNEVSATPSSGYGNAQIPYASTAPVIHTTIDAIWSTATAYPIATLAVGAATTDTGTWQALWDNNNR
jgi:cellulose 1,4-beta-cellobiosidase